MGDKWKGKRWKLLIFWKLAVTVNLKKLASNTIFWWYTFGKFYIVKFNYYSERLNKFWKTKLNFEIFLIDHCAGDIRNKNVAVKY